jgi:RNA 2',3'-cyclic 3'-phosphodiesterase
MRLFVAFDLSPEVRAAIVQTTASLHPEAPGARWSAPESLHVTLKFLGQTDDQKLAQVQAALQQIISLESVSLRFRGVGFFPDEKRPRVMWSGVERSPNIFDLASAIEESLKPLGFEPETRRFVPHVTLARLNSARNLEKLVRAAAPLTSYDFGATRESQFHLYESVLKKSGSEYKKLATFPFVKEAQ